MAGCGEDELLGTRGMNDGSAAGMGALGSGGRPDGSAGRPFDGGGGSSATGGSAGQSGTGGGGGDAGDASNGCLAAGSEYKLDVCLRLTRPLDIVATLVPAYFGSVHNDCRVARLVDEHPNLAEFGNALTHWSLDLWGCRENGATTFGLVDEVTALTAADARVLIDRYLAVATLRLSLSTAEEADMRRALGCLANLAITDPSTTEHALSKCTPDAGADGGNDSGTADGAADASTDDGGDAGDASVEGGGDSGLDGSGADARAE
jgi:hypothetical protein